MINCRARSYGGDVVRRGQPGSPFDALTLAHGRPGSGGASPSYLRRACHELASARRMGLFASTCSLGQAMSEIEDEAVDDYD
jgi:hypothetical protein